MKVRCLLISILLIFIVLVTLFFLKLNYSEYKSINLVKFKKLSNVINDISKYSKYVKTIKESTLYDEEYKEIGTINKDVELELTDIIIYEEKIYYKIKNLNYYIYNNNVEKIDKLNIDKRYKKYILFNQNVITKNNTTLYNDKGYVYKLNKGINLPLIIKDNDKYYIEYNDQLLYVKKSEAKLENHKNTNQLIRTNIRTFTYHAIFKPGEKCSNVIICHPYQQFDSHMKYLHDNNYLTLTMEELEMFLDKKINIPTKSVVITLDDGNLAKNAIEILDKYEINATYFVITGRYDAYKLPSKYVKYESHTDNLHNNYKCPGGEQGGQLLCEKEDIILKDLKTSQEKLGGSHYLSYPFFDFNERAKKLLKKAGFHLAFIGQYNSEGYSDFNTDRFMIRRKTIFNNDSLETFISYLK